MCFINLPGILNPTQLKVKINNITSVLKILHMKVRQLRQLIGDCQNLWFTTRELQYNDLKEMYTKPDWVAQDNNLSFSGGQSWGLQIQSLPEDFLKWVQNQPVQLKTKKVKGGWGYRSGYSTDRDCAKCWIQSSGKSIHTPLTQNNNESFKTKNI